MESRLPRFRLTDHHLKDSPSRSHISPPFESCSSRQPILQDSGLPVVKFSKRQDATKKHNQESRERGDSRIPISTTLAKSSSLQKGGQRIQFCEQRTAHESRQDQINSFELDSVIQSKPNEIFTFVQRSSGRSGRASTGHCLPGEALKVAEKQNDEALAAERLGQSQMFASSRVLELRRMFEAFEGEQSKRTVERENIRREDEQERHLKDELNQQKTDYTAPTLDIDRHNEPLTNDTALDQPDLAVFPPQQQSLSNKSPYRRWTWMYPRPTLSLPSTQHPSAVKKKNEALCRQGRLDQRFESCENIHDKHYKELVVIEETMREQLPFRKTPADEQFLENGNGKANIDSGDGNSYDGSISLHNLRNSKREAIETKSGERSLNYSRARQAPRNLDEPRFMDGVINPVGRVHSEPLTRSSLMKTSRPESPRRRIFETKSDKMVSQTAYRSSHTGEKKKEEEKEENRDKGGEGALSKQRNECRAEGHRSFTDHRTEGMKVFARNKYVCHRTTTTFSDSTGSCKLDQKSDESAHCINAGSKLEQDDDLVGENYQLSVEDNEAMEVVAETQVVNTNEQKEPHITELTSRVHDGRLQTTHQPLPSDEGLQPLTDLAHSSECSVTVDRYCCSRPDCSSSGNQLTGRSIGDFYLSSSLARRIAMRGGTTSDYSYRLSPSDDDDKDAQSETKEKAWLSFDSESPFDSSPYGVQLRLSPSSQSTIQAHHPKRTTKASREPSESKLKTVEGITTDPIQHLLCCRSTSKEAFAKQMTKAIESDNCLLQRQSKVSLKAARPNSATSFAAIHCIPNEAAAQFSANFAENDQHMETTFDDDMSEDILEMKSHLEFPGSSHQGQIDQNETMMSCTEFIDLLDEDKPIEVPVRNSVLSSVKPVNGVISMYRTQGPIISKFSDRVMTEDLSRSRCKTALVLPRNTSSRKRDLCQLQTVALETCKPTLNQTNPILRSSDSFSKPLRKLTAEKGDEHVRKYDDRHQTMFRQQPRWPKARQKRQLHANLPTSCSTDSFTTDCELNARSLPAEVQHPWNTLRRRRHSSNGPKIINTRASASRIDDSASSAGSSANFRRAFRQLRQQPLAEELDETSSIEELVKGYDHPLYLSENESDVDDQNICSRTFNVEISNLLANTGNEEAELIEEESTVITRQMQTDRGTEVLSFRQCFFFVLFAIVLISLLWQFSIFLRI